MGINYGRGWDPCLGAKTWERVVVMDRGYGWRPTGGCKGGCKVRVSVMGGVID